MDNSGKPESSVAAPTDAEETLSAAESAGAELLGGAVVAAIGAGALYVGSSYRMGTSLNMGAGYFPRMVAAGLLVIGLALVVKGWRSGRPAFPALPVRPTAAILGATLVFGYLVESAGLFLTCALSVAVASLGPARQDWRRVAVIALALAACASLIFGRLLGLPLPIWPRPWIF